MIRRKKEFALDAAGSRKLLASYFPVNDPLLPLSLLKAFDTAKVDVVELGMKAQDAFADGATVTEAMQRAHGKGLVSEALPAIEAVRNFHHNAMGIIFGYASEVFKNRPEIWTEVDGLLCLGRDEEERQAICSDARIRGTRITEFVSYEMPLTTRSAAIKAESYVMLQYLPGKTGARTEIDKALTARLAKMRRAGVVRPILTGIGISAPDQVRHAIDAGADGVVIGSKTIQMGLKSYAALEDYLCEIRDVLDGK